MPFAAEVSIEAALSDLAGKVDALHRVYLEQLYRVHPAEWTTSLKPVTAAGESPTTPLTVIADPPGGMCWEVQRLSFGVAPGGTITTQGVLSIYRDGVWIAGTSTLPNFITFSRYECLVMPNTYLTAQWVGGLETSGSGLTVQVSAAEYPILALKRSSA